MQELNAALHKGGARAALTERLEDKAKRIDARLFNLNSRLFVIVPPQDEWDLVQHVFDVRTTVIKTVGREASELGLDPSEFTQCLHTRRDGDQLRQLADRAVRGHTNLRGPLGPPGPLTASHVEAVERQTHEAGAVAFVREFGRMQAIARVRQGSEPEGRGHEIFISLDHMSRQLLPNVDIRADRELFQELTQILDRVVLRSLAESRLVQGSVAINLNVANLLSADFERLAQRMYDRDGAQLWVDLDLRDVLANLRDFRDAQLVLKRFKVRTMSDTTAPEAVATAEQRELGLDGYKFVCPEDEESLSHISGTLKQIQEANRIAMLTRVEHESAISAGHQMGIEHFQGFYINDLLSGFVERPVERS
jgi:EAL domain-containing protein (putative c-di-GMP-specific phosphodiesterase class I)